MWNFYWIMELLLVRLVSQAWQMWLVSQGVLNVTVKPPETNMKNLHETILYGCYMDQVMWDNIWDTKQVSRKCNFPRDISQKLQYENIASSSAATDFFLKKQVTL